MAENTRTKNVMRNGTVSLLGYVIVFILGLLTRRFFLENLNITNLGYDGLFTNLFIIIGAVDMGAGTLLLYRLYQSTAASDDQLTRKYIAMAAKLYAVSATAMLLIGIAAMPFLQYLILDEVDNWTYVYQIYLIQLIGTVGVGYISYHRLVLLTYQRSSDIAIIETVTRICMLVIKIFIVLLTKNYIYYVIVTSAYYIVTNIAIIAVSRRRFKDLFGGTCRLADFREVSFQKELKGVWSIRLINLVYYLTDTVLISAMLGLKTVALYSNYVLLGNNVYNGIVTLLKPLSDSVANFMNTTDANQSYRLYGSLNLLVFFIAAIVLTGFSTLFQPVIAFAFGAQYLLPLPFVVLYSLSLFVRIYNYSIIAFRLGIGEYQSERIWAFLSALVNAVLSILCAKRFGIAGILFGTFVSDLITHAGYHHVTFRHFFQQNPLRDTLYSFLMMALAAVEAAVVFLICQALPVSIPGILLRMALCLVLPTLINWLVFRKTIAFSDAFQYVLRAMRLLRDRLCRAH